MLFVFLFAALGAGLPLQNTTAKVEKVGWAQAPQTRGTFDLLLSCLTTLSLCAWTAYHPNINSARSGWSKWAHRMVWMLIAIFVPEAVLWCAWEQWWAARRLRKKINDFIDGKGLEEGQTILQKDRCFCNKGDQELEDMKAPPSPSLALISANLPKTSASLKHWSTEQAFFALCGGFALPSHIPSRPPLTLTPTGILLLFELELFPDIPRTTITDKSKADNIAKALVCLQAGWFLVQCIARAAKKLPVTVLEIHVLAHVLCAFAIYAVWFEKGYDIGSPIVIEGNRAEHLGALFALDAGPIPTGLHRNLSKVSCSSTSAPFTVSEIASSHNRPIRHSSTLKYSYKCLESFGANVRSNLPEARWKNPNAETPEMTFHVDSANHALEFLKERQAHLKMYIRNAPIQEDTKEQNGEEPNDDTSTVANSITTVHFNKRYTVPTRSDLVVEGLDNETKKSLSDVFHRQQIVTYAFLSTLYALLHVLPWSPSHFPTLLEYNLWRSSTIAMLAAPISVSLAVALMSAGSALDSISKTAKAALPQTKQRIAQHVLAKLVEALLMPLGVMFVMVFCVAGLLYPFARVYLLVESFTALRSADKRIYKTVEWAEFLPHAG